LFRFICRFAAMILLALAVVLAVLDITRSITASAPVMTPLMESWSAISPSTLESAGQAVESWGVAFLWDPILLSILKLPSWLVLGLISVLLFWIGQRRASSVGRFASH